MDSTLIFMGIAILVVIYLIFKFIKKLVFAVFTLFLFLILIVVGIAGIVYMDYSYLTSQNNFDLKVVYKTSDKYAFGSNIKIVNQTPDLEKIKTISSKELTSLKPEDISSEDKMFVIVMDEELFKSIMTKDSYSIPGINSSEQLKKYDLSLTKFDVIEVINAEDDIGKFIEIVLKKNKLSVLEKTLFETIGKQMIKSELDKKGITLKEAVFLTVVSEEMQNEKNVIKLVEGFKDETLMIYPERFSFKLVRLLPVDTIQGFISK